MTLISIRQSTMESTLYIDYKTLRKVHERKVICLINSSITNGID